MNDQKLPEPTDAELEILQVLWGRGPSTVRDAFEVLSQKRSVGYTTVLKLLQIMLQKGLVQRDSSEKSHVYSAALSEEETQKRLVGELLQRAFGGSAVRLVMQALSAKKATLEELAGVRQFLDQVEGRSE
ncbi:MAG TPA: BlaI/MecI/CopY family transcriptional regulator [Thermoanaerobaculia bacterium]|nr:BlaI/MecI/CopY family transcriptional regulator [Thermoanaerobaculia bacterium]